METLVQPDQHQESKHLADKAGVDQLDFAKIAALGLPLILQGMNRNNQSEEGLASFNQALNQHQDTDRYASFNQLSQDVDPQEGNKILGHVFGNNEKEEIDQSLADRLGVNPETVKKVLAVLAPIAIKYLADKKREKNMDAGELQRETEALSHQAAAQAQEKAHSGGLLGDLFASLTDSPNQQEKSDGLLGNLFNLFK